MIKSMTGYGRSNVRLDDLLLTVEVKSVNHRFLETVFRMPKQFMMYEDKMKKQISSFIHRGRLDIFITIDDGAFVKRKIKVDHSLIQEIMSTLSTIKKEQHIHTDITLDHLLHFEDAFSIIEEEQENEELEKVLFAALKEAMEELSQMRMTEGKALFRAFSIQLETCRAVLTEIQKHAPLVCQKYRERIEKRMKEMLSQSEEWDEYKILTEVAIFSDKCDITEECTRLKSHFDQFSRIIQEEGPVGRKLDFLIQEMNREVNTIGSKATDVNISKQVVELKSMIEKMKEQVQNIE